VTRRTALLLAAAAALGVGVSAALLATRDDSSPAPRRAATAKATPIDNRFRLSHAESLRLVDWAERFRSCMGRRGVVLGAPVAHPKQIDLAFVRVPGRPTLLREIPACGDALGGPPRRSSLQLRPGKLVLYLPKRCLLDKRVVSGTTRS
jgi:hypothetical protein